MKSKIIYSSIIIVLAFIFYMTLITQRKHHPKPIKNAAIESAHYNWLRLRDPATNQIPKNIAAKENAYKKILIQNLPKKSTPVAKDWLSRGPYNIGGRTKALALDIEDENTILAGGVSCGMWKSTNGGTSWIKTTKPDQLHSVSCIAQNKVEGKQHIWYYGTGEGAPSGRGGSASIPLGTNSYYRGDGIFKSTDNGDSWYLLSSTASETPTITDAFDFVWNLATFGEDGIFAASSSGLFKSTNGGDSWQHALDFGEKYPSCEIALTSQEICYATIGGDGPANGIYRSVDGEIWENISPPDWPDTTTRTVIAIAPSNEKVVYFLTEVAHWKQYLRKYEQGIGWTNLDQNLPYEGEMTTYGGNMLILYVKPDDANTVFLGTVGLYRSTDAGQSFEVIGAFDDFHVDQHAIVFLPSNPKTMIVGNDGGLFKTNDNMAEVTYDPKTGEYHIDWESLNNGYLTTQFYSIAIDHGTTGSETVLGGTQDNAWLYTKTSDPQIPWQAIFGGAADGGFTAITDGGEYFYTTQAATFAIWRHSFPEGEHQWTMVTPTATLGGGIWLPPFLLDPFDDRIMYLPWRQQLWRNSDLTEIPYVFPPVPTDVNWTQFENVQDHYISALNMSAALPRRLYYSSHYGRLFYLDNPQEGQPAPVDITADFFPFGGYYIHCIAVDPRDANKVMVVSPNYGVISIYASDDGGDSWIPVSGNLEEFPDGSGSGPSVRWVSILYVQDSPVYFAGTSVGLFSTTKLDSMNTKWIPEGANNIGNIVIDMIDVRQSDGYVAVATHGNGVYSSFITEIPSYAEEIIRLPGKFVLHPAFPNPFNAFTRIRFSIPYSGPVRLSVYNILGAEVLRLIDRQLSSGEHKIQWNAKDTASGTYIIELRFDNYYETQKVFLIK